MASERYRQAGLTLAAMLVGGCATATNPNAGTDAAPGFDAAPHGDATPGFDATTQFDAAPPECGTAGQPECPPDCDATNCAPLPSPTSGQVVVNELMLHSATLGESAGQWIELHNPSTDDTYTLAGCRIANSDDNQSFQLSDELILEPQAFVTLAATTGQERGFVPDQTWDSEFALDSGADRVALYCPSASDEQLIDDVRWDSTGTFPHPTGASSQLDPDYRTAADNDPGFVWCAASYDWGIGDRGTPGAGNAQCGEWTIAACRVQTPEQVAATSGTEVQVFGRVRADDLTTITTSGASVGDPNPRFLAELGYGPRGTDPAGSSGWLWSDASINTAYGDGSPEFEPMFDEYQAQLVVPELAGSPYDYAFRFSGNAGGAYTYCDTGAGSTDGYDPNTAGAITVNEVTEATNLLISELVEGSGTNKAVELFNGTELPVDLAARTCLLRIYFNGTPSAGSTIALTGTVEPNSTFVACASTAAAGVLAACDLPSTTSFFNGNDAVELVCDGETIDVAGQIGVDPGVQWSANGVGTANATLRRACDVTTGDTTGDDAFDPSVQWQAFPEDTFEGLGSHSACAR